MVSRLSLVVTAAVVGAATAASAQDLPGAKLPFSGLYVGAAGGYDIQSNDVGSKIEFDRTGAGTFNDQVSTTSGADAFAPGFCNGRARDAVRGVTGCESDRNRGSYYGRAGFDVQHGHFVVGALGEFGKSEIRDYVSAYSITPANYVFERGLRWEGSARLRAGLAFGTTLFYATGGAGVADIRHRFTTTNTSNAFADNGNTRRVGFIVGTGIEKYLTPHVTFGVEYSYHDYKDGEYRVTVTQGSAAATNPFVLAPYTSTRLRRSDDNFRWQSLRATVGYHF